MDDLFPVQSPAEQPAMKTFWYLANFCDEVMPCEPTPEAWAKWLSEGDGQFGHDAPAKDGATYDAFAMDVRWYDMHRGDDGKWALPADVKGGYSMLAVCDYGSGWDADDVVDEEDSLIEMLSGDWFDLCDRITLAVGHDHPNRYLATYSASGPTLTFKETGRPR